jgi:hypothetical protein
MVIQSSQPNLWAIVDMQRAALRSRSGNAGRRTSDSATVDRFAASAIFTIGRPRGAGWGSVVSSGEYVKLDRAGVCADRQPDRAKSSSKTAQIRSWGG